MRIFLMELALLPWIAACATTPYAVPAADRPTGDGPTLTLPFVPSETTELRQTDDEFADATRLPVGVGFTAGPSTVLLGAALDIPLDEHLTIGPALQFGYDTDRQIFAPVVQVKYHLPGTLADDATGQFRLMPYLQAGVGVGYIDKSGQSGETGFLLNGGAGIRYLTGKKYRLGSEALINWLPSDVGGENLYFSWEVVQVIFEF